MRRRPLRLTQARIGDTLHDGNGTRVAIVNAFTTVKPETVAIVRAVDYQVVGAPDQFRVYSDYAGDVARWRRVETPGAPWPGSDFPHATSDDLVHSTALSVVPQQVIPFPLRNPTTPDSRTPREPIRAPPF